MPNLLEKHYFMKSRGPYCVQLNDSAGPILEITARAGPF